MFDNHRLVSLIEEFPLGFYVCDLDRFDRNYCDFLSAFSRHYSNSRIAYSFKTNYLPAVCQRAYELGGYAEVVSGMEFRLARRIGISGSDIVFNGPVKSREDLLTAARNRAIVNVETDHEISQLEEIGRDFPSLEFRIGLRCAVHLDHNSPSRFGFDIDHPCFWNRVQRLQAAKNIRFGGLHCHSIPPGRTAKNYGIIAQRLVELARDIWGPSGPEFIDMGGGYFSRMSPELRQQFGVDVPSFEDYGKAITTPMLEAFDAGGRPELILEPGLAIVADAFYFVCRVLDTKTTLERNLALASASVYNIRPTKSPRNLPMRHVSSVTSQSQPINAPLDIVGYTCMEDDVLYRGYGHPLAVGDLLVFSNVGAYTLVLKPPFIQGNVPVLAWRKAAHGKQILKRAETLGDLFSSFGVDD
jgi:diaminopimelate decarboxylase